MSHEIATSAKTGRAQYFEAKKAGEEMRITAWHTLGDPITEDVDVIGALNHIDGNFDVEKHDTYRVVVRNGVQVVEKSEKAFVTVRTDTGAELGGVGPQYRVLQNREAFAPIQPMIDAGVLRLRTGGVLRNGEDAFVMGEFKQEALGKLTREVFDQLGIKANALFSNNHSGRKNATVATVDQVVVCANTHKAAEDEMRRTGRYVAVSHRGNVAKRFDEATDEMFGSLMHRFDVTSAHYLRMQAATLTEAEFGKLVLDAIVPPRKIDDDEKNKTRVANLLAKDEAKRNTLTELWNGAGTGLTGNHSAWEAWNTCTEAVDHNLGNLFESRDRLVSLYDGTLQRTKEKVFTNIIEAVSVPTSLIDQILRVHYSEPTATLLEQILGATVNN